MSNPPRTGFAAIPPEPATGQVRRFPLQAIAGRPHEGQAAGPDERVLVVYRGENTVYDSPAALAEAIRAAAPAPVPPPVRPLVALPDLMAGIVLGALLFVAIVGAL
ncbi:hypothetical protein [Phenylobacterium sp.]|uniref:hypothetical protein n=1 Tax=Phenylobacterium sp. TaxID=1871053 RepID=UPI00395D6796